MNTFKHSKRIGLKLPAHHRDHFFKAVSREWLSGRAVICGHCKYLQEKRSVQLWGSLLPSVRRDTAFPSYRSLSASGGSPVNRFQKRFLLIHIKIFQDRSTIEGMLFHLLKFFRGRLISHVYSEYFPEIPIFPIS